MEKCKCYSSTAVLEETLNNKKIKNKQTNNGRNNEKPNETVEIMDIYITLSEK